MRLEDIEGTEQLCSYIHLELVRQTQTKKTLVLQLPEKLFYKLIKLIQFYVKDDRAVSPDCVKFFVRINGTLSIITKK